MKLHRLLRLLSFVCLVFFVVAGMGCATIDQHLPEGHAAKLRYVRTGKFSSTTVEAVNFEKTAAHVKADRWVVKHSNAWLPNVEIDAEGYERLIAQR